MRGPVNWKSFQSDQNFQRQKKITFLVEIYMFLKIHSESLILQTHSTYRCATFGTTKIIIIFSLFHKCYLWSRLSWWQTAAHTEKLTDSSLTAHCRVWEKLFISACDSVITLQPQGLLYRHLNSLSGLSLEMYSIRLESKQRLSSEMWLSNIAEQRQVALTASSVSCFSRTERSRQSLWLRRL